MKFAIGFVTIFAIAFAVPVEQQHQDAQVLRFDSDVQPDGYKYIVETSDGKLHQEEGQLKDANTDHEAIVVRGTFSYIGDDGQKYQVNYVADENGFQPEGSHLPQAL